MTDSFESIAVTRLKGMATRLGQASLAAVIAWLLHPSLWPLLWAAAYFAAQIIDRRLFRDSLGQAETSHQGKLIVSIAANCVIFSSLSVYNWCLGGVEGKIFAAITICCSLISVTLTMYYKKRYLYAAFIPHALYLISLPVISLMGLPSLSNWPMAIVTISIVTYLLYLMVAIRKLNGSMIALRTAGDEAVAARQVAEQANAAKSNFLAVITHEIRTPMNAVVSSLNFLRRTPLNNEQKAHIAMLESASEVLLALLNDVLDLARIESGRMHFERTAVDPAELLAGLEALFTAQAQERGLKLKFVIAPEVPDCILGDPLRLKQILFNLVSNAVKFTDRGAVTLRLALRACDAGMNLVFEVEDEGIGIAEDNLDRIFLSFEQAETATTRRYGGTGLGLAISRRLARLMGGDLTVRSQPGIGSCFYLSLPCQATAAVALPAPAPVAGEPDAPLHVLIVDDHEVNRRIVSLFIQPLGWAWTMADNGVEAVKLCRDQRFDVILMDMQMPVMDGITATGHIRDGDGPNKVTPVVALTANALDSHRAAWAEAGVHTVLAKPIDPDLLIRALLEHAGAAMQADVTEDEALSA